MGTKRDARRMTGAAYAYELEPEPAWVTRARERRETGNIAPAAEPERRVYSGRCPRCRGGVSVRWTLEEIRGAGYQVLSGCCSRWTVLQTLDARRVAGVRCGSRCTGAVGPSCECECGGENHGARFRVAAAGEVAPAGQPAPLFELEEPGVFQAW